MSTRSAIVIETPKGARGIYCHFDGYPEHHGPILRDHYQDRAKVERLIALGDISSLAENVEPTSPAHSYDSAQDGVTVAYMRDRGETGCEPTVGKDVADVTERIGHNGHVYVFGLDDKWMHNGIPLDEAIRRAAEEDES